MDHPLKKDQMIYLLLLVCIPIPCISSKINSLRISFEKKDIYKYHYERWETIASKYFNATKNLNRFISKVYFTSDNVKYISHPDFLLDFYHETKISQQGRDMLLELVCIQDKTKRMKDDELYSQLSKMIMDKMRSIK